MQELEKILEEIDEKMVLFRSEKHSSDYMAGGFDVEGIIKGIIRKHMKEANGTFAFDFSRTDSFDCPCGRHYVHMKMSPKLKFCPECEEKVRNNRTDICPECRKRKLKYEKKNNCIVDIGINGAPGDFGKEAEQEEV